MKGYLKITVDNENVQEGKQGMVVDVNLSEVNIIDKLFILRHICRAIEIDERLLTVFCAAEKSGILETHFEEHSCKCDDEEDENCGCGETCSCGDKNEDGNGQLKVNVMALDVDDFLDMLFGGKKA